MSVLSEKAHDIIAEISIAEYEQLKDWILENHPAQEMEDPPEGWNQEKEFYFRPNPLLPVQVGPVLYEDVRNFIRGLKS